jgi:hypothetical protein
VLDAVAPDHLRELDRLVGQYATGKTPVYRGSFVARDNLGSVGPTYHDGTISATSAIASLAADTLTVESPAEGRHVVVSQAAGTSLSFVLDDNVSGGASARAGSVPPMLTGAPPTITMDLVANGTWGDGSAMIVSARGSLSRVAASTLAFDDIVHLSMGYADRDATSKLVAAGPDRVRTVASELHEPTAVPPGKAFYECHHVTSYTIDWYVESSNLASYGVRNLQIAKSETCCVDGPEIECTPENRTCF